MSAHADQLMTGEGKPRKRCSGVQREDQKFGGQLGGWKGSCLPVLTIYLCVIDDYQALATQGAADRGGWCCGMILEKGYWSC
jgi:hypothetical protein